MKVLASQKTLKNKLKKVWKKCWQKSENDVIYKTSLMRRQSTLIIKQANRVQPSVLLERVERTEQ